MIKHVYTTIGFYVLLGLLLIYGQFDPASLPHPADRQYISALVLALAPSVYLLTLMLKSRYFQVWKEQNTLIRANDEYLNLKFIYVEDELPDDGEKVIAGWISTNNDARIQDAYILSGEWFDSKGEPLKSPPDVWISMPIAYKH